MRPLRRLFSLLLCLALLLSCSALASAEDLPYLLPVQLGGGSFQVRAYSDGYGNNIYLSLADLSTALSGTEKQFALGFASTPTDGDMFLLTSGQPSAGPSTAGVNDRRRVSSLYLFRNRLFLDNRELKYYTCRLGTDLYMSLTDIQLMLDFTIQRSADGGLRLYPERPFRPDVKALEAEGYFGSFNAVLLGDADTGEILYLKQGTKALPIASLSKLMSYLLIAESVKSGQLRLDEPVPVTQEALDLSLSADGIIDMSGVAAVSVSELLDAMLLASSNESALTLAQYLAGSESAFVEAMSRRAGELGLSSAEFHTVNGLPWYTPDTTPAKLQNCMSAFDLFKLCRHLLAFHPELTARTSQLFGNMPTLNYITANSNALVFNLPGVNGLKTGNTNRAGYCLISTLPVTAGGATHTVLLIVLGAETPAMRNQASHMLLQYARTFYAEHGFSTSAEPLP